MLYFFIYFGGLLVVGKEVVVEYSDVYLMWGELLE